MEKRLIESHSENETYAFGQELGRAACPGQCYVISGDLGSGKTVLSKGVAAGLGITEPVTSPTFTIVKVYESGRLPLYHLDVYRIGDISEMEEVGLEDMLEGDGVCLIEWGERVEEILPRDAIRIRIDRDDRDFDHRRITCLS